MLNGGIDEIMRRPMDENPSLPEYLVESSRALVVFCCNRREQVVLSVRDPPEVPILNLTKNTWRYHDSIPFASI